MAAKGAVLASRILNEVAALGLVVGRVERAWKVRNVYTYHISPDKMKPLANGIRPLFKQVEKELAAFSRFNQMVLKALRIVAIGRKSSSALSGKGMKPN
jgi:predicted transcriptional regulator